MLDRQSAYARLADAARGERSEAVFLYALTFDDHERELFINSVISDSVINDWYLSYSYGGVRGPGVGDHQVTRVWDQSRWSRRYDSPARARLHAVWEDFLVRGYVGRSKITDKAVLEVFISTGLLANTTVISLSTRELERRSGVEERTVRRALARLAQWVEPGSTFRDWNKARTYIIKLPVDHAGSIWPTDHVVPTTFALRLSAALMDMGNPTQPYTCDQHHSELFSSRSKYLAKGLGRYAEQIHQALTQEPKTVSQLSRELAMKRDTIIKHTKALEEVGLAERTDQGWKATGADLRTVSDQVGTSGWDDELRSEQALERLLWEVWNQPLLICQPELTSGHLS